MTTECPKCQAKNPDSQSFCGECGAPLSLSGTPKNTQTQTFDPPKKELTTGSVFANRYQIIEELGRGGMGRVYKAFDTEINEKLAIKLLKPEIASDSKTISRFRNELRLARGIRHKNVCQMYDISKEKGSYYITMEYVRGEDLKHLIRKIGGLSQGQVVNVTKQICQGLAAAHKIGVVHRDLKPQNIMLDEEGWVRIMDFGIAHSVKSKGLTGAGMIIGTPEYMSPEQVEGKPVDARSDIYSTGIILFEMLTGQVPFEAETAFAVGYKHKNEPVPDPRSINPQINKNLSQMVLRCLEKDPRQRFQSAQKLLTDLIEAEKTLPITTTEKVIPQKKTLTSKEFTVTLGLKKILIPGAVLLALAAVLMIWLLRKNPQAVFPEQIENSVAVVGFENLTGDSGYDYLKKAIPNLILTNLENTGFLHVATWERMEDIRKQVRGPEMENMDRDTGFEICKREGIKNIVTGSFTKAGDMFAIDVKVLDVHSKNLVKSTSTRGQGEDSILRSQIDDLSREISTGIGISKAKLDTTSLDIENITTDSMEAYQNYLKGVEAYDKFYYDQAKKYIENAIALDPQFAVAYLYLGRVQGALGHREARDEAYVKAKELSQKATEKERLMIQAHYAGFIEDDSDQRIALLEEMKRKYPREKYPYFQLGMIYDGRNKRDEAIQNLEKAIELDPQYGAAYNQLAYTLMDKGDYDQALLNFEKYAALNPKDANPIDSMAELYFRLGQFEKAIAKYKQVSQLSPGFYLSEMHVSIVYGVMEQYDKALYWLDVFIQKAPSTGIKSEGYLWKSILLSRTGQYKESTAALDKAKEMAEKARNPWRLASILITECWLQYNQENWNASRKALQSAEELVGKISPENKNLKILILFDHGLIDLKTGDVESAKKRLETMQPLFKELESEYKQRGYQPGVQVRKQFQISWLQGKILMKEGKLNEAVPVLRKAHSSKTSYIPTLHTDQLGPYFHPLRMEELAQIYVKQGNLDKAIAEYQRLLTRRPSNNNRRLVDPIYHFELGKLYEQKGQTDLAVQEYEKFVDINKNADPGYSVLKEAQKRLSRLR